MINGFYFLKQFEDEMGAARLPISLSFEQSHPDRERGRGRRVENRDALGLEFNYRSPHEPDNCQDEADVEHRETQTIGNFLYISTSDGWIKKLHLADGSVEDWKHVGGRPLGRALGNDGEVLVCKPFQGLLKVTEDGVEVLATEVDGTKLLLVDGVAVAKDGLIYFTDISTKYTVDVLMRDYLEGRPNGRIVVYDPASKSTRLLLKDVYFPNGIALSRDDSFLLFSETSRGRISKHYRKGDRKGTTETPNENLPGLPDNIRYNAKGDILYVGIVRPRDAIIDLLWKSPFVKSLVSLYPSLLKPVDRSRKAGAVLAIDENGRPLKWYQDPSGKTVAYLTAGADVDGFL